MQHPLFPEHEPDARELGFIRVWRHERDGGRFCAPSSFGADELTDVSQVFESFGGGRYELVAHEPNGRVLARQRYAFEGPSKPLDGTGGEAPNTGHAPAAPPAASAEGGQFAMFAGLMQMFLQMQAASAKQQTELIIALMNKGESNANQHVQAMTQLYSAFGQNQGALLKAALEQRQGGGGDTSTVFMKGLEFGRSLNESGGDGEDDPLDGILGSIGEFMAGMQMAKQQPPAPSAPPPPPEQESQS